MSKFSIGLAPNNAARIGTRARTHVHARVNANIRRPFPYTRFYFAVIGFLALVAGLSVTAALWRLFHFAR